MSRQVLELETIMQSLIEENHKMLAHLERHQVAMKSFDLKAMDGVVHLQESTRLRIATLEAKRRLAVQTIARGHRMTQSPTVAMIAALYPASAPKLLKQRMELMEIMQKVQTRSHIAGKIAGAVLGHLNTVVRLLAGAVEKAGLYTKQGVPQVSSRIGVMEAVG